MKDKYDTLTPDLFEKAKPEMPDLSSTPVFLSTGLPATRTPNGAPAT